jgi:hypothetical protein
MSDHKTFETLTIEEFEREAAAAADDLVALLVSKRKSYGPANLTRFGLVGIAIRASDKVERIATMTREGVVASDDGDSLDDAFRDLAGYGLLGVIYRTVNGAD